MTLDAYLTQTLRCDPIVADFYTRYAIDALGGTASQVNAHSSISFLGAEYGDRFSFPGGTSELAERLVHWLMTDQENCSTTIRLDAVGLRVDEATAQGKAKASVTYFKDNIFHRATASAVILACQSHVARHLIAHLSDAPRQRALSQLSTVPVVVANVGIRSAAPFVESGIGYNQYYWGSRYWASFVVADWVTPQRNKADRSTVLTFFGGNTAPPEDLAQERMRLLHTPFADYEQSLKQDLSRIMAGAKFEFDRDVTSISLYRWGHGMIMPTTTSVFGNAHGPHGQLDRAKAPRRVAFAPLGRISFAGQDSEGAPSVESAMSSGLRAAVETLPRL
jgi:spermidine dehydrogenase